MLVESPVDALMTPPPTTDPHPSREKPPESSRLRQRLHEIVFEADTPGGKLFDVVLLVLICLSVVAVCLESVRAIRVGYGGILRVAEWVFTVLFSIEYAVRLCNDRDAVRST
jgi:voltage-gated potassium channel